MPAMTPPNLGPAGAVLVQRSATFVPELGQSFATAKQKVVNEMAQQMVNVMELAW
jgi:hypothetical protein